MDLGQLCHHRGEASCRGKHHQIREGRMEGREGGKGKEGEGRQKEEGKVREGIG